MGRKSGEEVGLSYCHGLGGNQVIFFTIFQNFQIFKIIFLFQVFAYTKRQQVMSDDNCLDAASPDGPVKLVRCHGMGGNQAWVYNDEVCEVYRPGQPNWEYTMWKFQNFSATQIFLREINFGHFVPPKTAILII